MPPHHDKDLCRSVAHCAALAGLVSAVLLRHISSGLVSAPPSLLAVVALFMLVGLSCAGHARTYAGWFALGLLLGIAIPDISSSPSGAVLTHAPRSGDRDDLIIALEQLDDDPTALLGHRLTVSGTWHAQTTEAAAAVSRRIMACCAADAVDVGFDVYPASRVKARNTSRVSVSGVVHVFLRKGETRYALIDARVVSEENSAVK